MRRAAAIIFVSAGLAASACRPAAGPESPETVAAAPATGDEASVRPGVNERYLEADAVETWTERFEHDDREVAGAAAEILAALPLESGQSVVDFGSGTGLFTGRLADAVGPQGRVVGVDIIPAFVEAVRAENAERPQVEVRLVEAKDPKLEAGRYDLVFVCNVYHHIEYPRTLLPQLRAALRPGGHLVVIDFRRIEGVTRPAMLRHVRADQATVRAEIEAAGFRHVEDLNFLDENYFMRFER